MIERMKEEYALSYRALCRGIYPAYSSFMRWKGRIKRGEPAVRRPGPKKVLPLNFGALRSEVEALTHCRKRTHGTGELYHRYSSFISRRDLGRLVWQERLRMNWERRNEVKHLEWQKPCFVWAIDDTANGRLRSERIWLNTVKDVGSRYELPPVVTEGVLEGKAVAGHLEELFDRYGAPLFLKRDNGSNLTCREVDDVLAEHFVIPLNSPVAYPQYNGSRERKQRELKEYMRSRLPSYDGTRLQHICSLAVDAAHTVNHRPRRCLGRKTSCEVFFAGQDELRQYNRRKRKEVYDWIRDKAMAIMDKLDGDGRKAFEKAWRTSCEIWLQQAGILTISVQGDVLPEKTAGVVS